MGKPRVRRPRFHQAEVKEMQRLLSGNKVEHLDESFCQKLVEKFNNDEGRLGSKSLQWQQVQRWLRSRQKDQTSESSSSPTHSIEIVALPESSSPADSKEIIDFQESYSDIPMPKELVEKAADATVSDFEFEAQSSVESAWYDVATFLQYRCLTPGEPEVRVRFHGFGPDHDEWVNIKKAVRERSIPLESSECQKVEVGNLVLCFRENIERAAYFDAHVLEIERNVHDIRGCRCFFLVCYDHDQLQERIHSSRVCRRPSG